MLAVAHTLARRATCKKLAVGCVLVDGHGRILGTGYNGVPRGLHHCTEVPCGGATSPKGSDLCEAVHAEQNALLICRDPELIHTAYVTHAPCMRCMKMLLNTSCKQVVYCSNIIEPAALVLWLKAGRSIIQYPKTTGHSAKDLACEGSPVAGPCDPQ